MARFNPKNTEDELINRRKRRRILKTNIVERTARNEDRHSKIKLRFNPPIQTSVPEKPKKHNLLHKDTSWIKKNNGACYKRREREK